MTKGLSPGASTQDSAVLSNWVVTVTSSSFLAPQLPADQENYVSITGSELSEFDASSSVYYESIIGSEFSEFDAS